MVGLVLASLALLTVSFRSSALDPVEGFGASVLRPFEIAANDVARPFRDAANWTHGIFNAKSENNRLKAKIASLERRNANLKGAEEENTILRKDLNYVTTPTFPKDYAFVAAEVLNSPSAIDQTVTISAGTHDRIAENDVVVTYQGLVGVVSKVYGTESLVTLITDPSSSVRAVDLANQSEVGSLDHGACSSCLVLDGIGTNKPKVGFGDAIITAGSPAGGANPSLFPRNIPIGTVSNVSQSDVDIYQQILVQPAVDFSSLETVLVLIPKPSASK